MTTQSTQRPSSRYQAPRKKKVRVQVLALAALLALAASVAASCSDDGEQAVVIGYLTGSGVGEDVHSQVVDLAVEHFNEAGGIAGLPVAVLGRNTDNDPKQAVAMAEELVDTFGAIGFVGPGTSISTVSVSEAVTSPNKLILISPSATSPTISTLDDGDFTFRAAISDVLQGKVLADLAWEEGYRNVAVIHVEDPYGAGLAEQFEITFTDLGGTVTLVSYLFDSKPSYEAELIEASAEGEEVLVVIGHRADTIKYVPMAIESGYFQNFLFADASKSPGQLEEIGWDSLEGSLGTSAGAPPDREEAVAFREAFQTHYEREMSADAFVAESYDAAVLVGLAVAKAGGTGDREAIRDGLRAVAGPGGEKVGPGIEGIARALELIAEGEEINYEGASGSLDFDENGDVSGTIEIWQVKGGEIVSTGRFLSPQ